MTVLVTGSTGAVGSEVVRHLAAAGTEVRALTRSPDKADLPDGVTAVAGELTDTDAVRRALDGVSGLFLLSAVTAEELTGTLLALSLAQAAGVRDVVYLSVIHADRFTDPPHFAAKAAAERMIAEQGISATVLRPGYFMQNDAGWRDALLAGTYPPPVGDRGVLVVDTRDLGEIGARALLARQDAASPPPTETVDVVDPQTYTGSGLAGIWSDVLGRPVSYGGDDLDAFEQQMAGSAPGYLARDIRLMFGRFARDGLVAAPGTDERLQELLGRPMRSYRDFATETAASWR